MNSIISKLRQHAYPIFAINKDSKTWIAALTTSARNDRVHKGLKLGLILMLGVLLASCATTKPKRYVPNMSNDIAAYNPNDYGYAYGYFKGRAMRGDPIAEDNLAHIYEDGRGVPTNDTQAIYWFTKAANSGNSDAMLSLGVASLYGKGVPKDNKVACSWFAKARAARNTYAPDFYHRYC